MPVTELPSTPAGAGTRFEVRRDVRLTPRQRWIGFGAMAAGSLAMAFAFAAGGVWPVLPYSVLELSCLAAAFAWLERRSREWVAVTLGADRVVVETAAGGRVERRELDRAWLRVEIDAGGDRSEPVLVLRSGRQAMRVGGNLPAAERVALARMLEGRLPAR
ncbi:MAG: DUF2244 domain-containing protein [Burkholderiales bacterium]|nr:DUF2244 domain-containing protein [Burkholderiales bacterium]MCC7113077.1 DUF2244 domain-containing protein [Burkholderiales bacterium]